MKVTVDINTELPLGKRKKTSNPETKGYKIEITEDELQEYAINKLLTTNDIGDRYISSIERMALEY